MIVDFDMGNEWDEIYLDSAEQMKQTMDNLDDLWEQIKIRKEIDYAVHF